MEYYAHFDKEKGTKQFLCEHLRVTADIASRNIPPVVRFGEIQNITIKNMSRYINLFHDLGKYTEYYQKYLIEGVKSVEKNHAHISACFFYKFMLQKLTEIQEIENIHQKYAVTFIGYLCIRLHHRSLSFRQLLPLSEEKWEVLIKQAKHLLGKTQDILSDLNLKTEITLEQFREIVDIQHLKNEKAFFINMPYHLRQRLKSERWYFLLLYLFSVLIDADKLDSGGIISKQVKVPLAISINDYLRQKHKDSRATEEINKRREQARYTMLQIIDQLTDNQIKDARFFTITAPTGIGKTLSSLQCVLSLQARINAIEGYVPRIITAIPFINIIEQAQDDYENILREQCDIISHHRLAEIVPQSFDENEEISLDRTLLEVESWEGDVVLTTFVQLFQSLFSGNNRLLKKVNKIAGSIVILDEVQAVPDKYMHLIGALLRKIAEYYGTRFVLMTATQPKLLEFGDQLLRETKKPMNKYQEKTCNSTIELLPNHKEFFCAMNRTKFVLLLEKELDTEKFIELFFEKWAFNQSALIVVNTIKRSIDLFAHLKKKLQEKNIKIPVFYLSTNIMPVQRKKIIKIVEKKLKKHRPVILVSTQTIEAGVDLDFDIGFRDLAPITSLIQTAGRVNRKGEKGNYCPLYIVKFIGDSQNVYRFYQIKQTEEMLKKILEESSEILEPKYQEIIERYYSWLLEIGVSQESKDLWTEGIIGLDFNKLNEFALIENKSEVVDVFVETAEEKYQREPTRLANAYEEILRNSKQWNTSVFDGIIEPGVIKIKNKPDPYQRKALLRLILAKMSKYIIQVRASRVIQNSPIEFSARNGVRSQLFWIPPEQIKQYYDSDTGFKDETGKAFIF
ncbi:MAG: CRISPR-associated helicase/endonuclease Cas3 [Peptococcaceae bacterium]